MSDNQVFTCVNERSRREREHAEPHPKYPSGAEGR